MAKEKKKGPRLPAKQLSILAAVRFAEPLALTSVFPYLPEMIKSFGVPNEEVARWAGMISAIFSISQSVTAVPWGWASDRIGRKPTLVVGLFSTMVCFIFWGVSSSLPMALIVRGIQGSSNGNVGIIRTMVAEMVPERSLQPRAFALMPMVWSIGSVFGPSFGGFFARPAEQFPGIFGRFALLHKYPYLLPNLIAFNFFIISLLAAVLFLEETLETRRYSTDWGLELGERLSRLFCGGKPSRKSRRRALARAHAQARAENRSLHRRRSSIDDDDATDDEASAPLLSAASVSQDADLPLDNTSVQHSRLSLSQQRALSSKKVGIFTYQTTMVLVCYTFLALHAVASDQLLPVFLNYPTQTRDSTNTRLPFKFSGGFGMSAGRIGTIFTINALLSGVAQFLAFPPLCARYGALKCFRVGAALLPFVYLVTPYTVLVRNERLRYAAILTAFLCKGMVSIVTFPGITMILTNSAPSVKVLGTLNGFATTFSGMGRATGPAMAGATFTWGVKHGYVIAGWWFLGFVAILGAIATIFLEEGAGPEGQQEFAHEVTGDESRGLDAEHGAASPYGYDSSDEEEENESGGGLDGGRYHDEDDETDTDGNDENETDAGTTVRSRANSALLRSRHGTQPPPPPSETPASPLTESPAHSRATSQHWITHADAVLPAPTPSLFANTARAVTGEQQELPADEQRTGTVSFVPARPPLPQQRASHMQLPRLRPLPIAARDELREPDDPEPASAEDADGAAAAAAAEDATGLQDMGGDGAAAENGTSSSSLSPVRGRRRSLLSSRRGRHEGPAAVATGAVVPLSPVAARCDRTTTTGAPEEADEA